MIKDIIIPEELLTAVASESKEFVVKSTHALPYGRPLSQVLFGISLIGLVTWFFSVIIGPIFTKDFVQSISANLGELKNQQNPDGAYGVLIVFSVFLVIGIVVIITGMIPLFKKGGYFIGTPSRIVKCKNGNLCSYKWDEFTGNIRVRGTDKRGSIILDKTTGYTRNSKSRSYYVPYRVYMFGIQNIHEIEKICRLRISEHGPSASNV